MVCIFTKGNNFLWLSFSFSVPRSLSKMDSLLMKICFFLKEQILSYKRWPRWEGWQNEHGRVATPEHVSFTLNA